MNSFGSIFWGRGCILSIWVRIMDLIQPHLWCLSGNAHNVTAMCSNNTYYLRCNAHNVTAMCALYTLLLSESNKVIVHTLQ